MEISDALIKVWEAYNDSFTQAKYKEVFLFEVISDSDKTDNLPLLVLSWLKASGDDKPRIERDIIEMLIAGAYDFFEGDILELQEEEEAILETASNDEVLDDPRREDARALASENAMARYRRSVDEMG